jgi:hypothetical protein
VHNLLIERAGSSRFGFVDHPRRLFKFFSNKDHAEGLVDRGQIRIGTLYEFRCLDGWDAARGDVEEGQFTYTLESTAAETIAESTAAWYLRPIFQQLGSPIIESRGKRISITWNHPDSYVYCMTTNRTSEAMRAYGQHCVAIHDVRSFMTALTAHLSDSLRILRNEPHGYLAACLYLGRAVQVSSPSRDLIELPLPFVKPLERRAEGEVRAYWPPHEPHPRPVITICSELSAYCTLVST